MTNEAKTANIMPLAAEILVAHLSKNKVSTNDLPKLISDIVQALSSLSAGEPQPAPRSAPAIPISKSVTPDYIICLEDGKKMKMLKRHLRSAYKMSPDDYRKRWGLPVDYPMVAPNYAKQRSRLAKSSGLGTKPRGKRSQALTAGRRRRKVTK